MASSRFCAATPSHCAAACTKSADSGLVTATEMIIWSPPQRAMSVAAHLLSLFAVALGSGTRRCSAGKRQEVRLERGCGGGAREGVTHSLGELAMPAMSVRPQTFEQLRPIAAAGRPQTQSERSRAVGRQGTCRRRRTAVRRLSCRAPRRRRVARQAAQRCAPICGRGREGSFAAASERCLARSRLACLLNCKLRAWRPGVGHAAQRSAGHRCAATAHRLAC